jgi:hypothetical protein
MSIHRSLHLLPYCCLLAAAAAAACACSTDRRATGQDSQARLDSLGIGIDGSLTPYTVPSTARPAKSQKRTDTVYGYDRYDGLSDREKEILSTLHTLCFQISSLFFSLLPQLLPS